MNYVILNKLEVRTMGHGDRTSAIMRPIRVSVDIVMAYSSRLTLLAMLGICSLGTLAQSGVNLQRQPATQGYPDRPIRFIVPTPPSGGGDTLARVIGQKLSDALRQQVVIDNRPGAGGNLAAEIAAKAAPDGYTLLLTTVAHAFSTSLYSKLAYDLRRDFAPVTELAATPFLLVVRPSLPVESIADLVALAKAKPDLLNYASAGNGAPNHLAMELFKMAARISARHIPYKGAVQGLTDMMGGQIDMIFTAIATGLPLVKSGKVRALGVGSLKRTPTAPDILTIDEAGIKGFEASNWFGVQVPRGTPRPVVTVLHDKLVGILHQPDTSQRLAQQGFDLIGSTPEQFSDYIRVEISKWASAVKKSGARVD